MKNKIILTGLFLTTAISCSNFRPIVLNAFLDPETTASGTTYDDLNFSYALFNQYASGLTYKFRINFSNSLDPIDRDRSIFYADPLTFAFFTDWTIFGSNFVEGELNSVWRNRLNDVLFSRDFNRTTKLASTDKIIAFRKITSLGTVSDNTNLEIIIESSISYSVNVGSIYSSFNTNGNAGITSFEKYIMFYNEQNLLLTQYRLENNPSAARHDQIYNLSSITTNIRKFTLLFRWVDIPPYIPATDNFIILYEFNLFTQGQELSIPDDASGDTFGFEFVAVEWYNILGHLQNFAWWIVNKSPIAPVFEWIDTYVITWISGLITFIVGVFDL